MDTLERLMVKDFQDRAVNAWPALETLIYRGWIFRFANGFTKRANSVHPAMASSVNVADMVDYAESVYISRGLDVAFRMTNMSEPQGLDDELASRGYDLVYPVSVQTIGLGEIRTPLHSNLRVYTSVNDDWLNDICTLQPSLLAHKETMHQMFSKIFPETCFVTVMTESGQIGACGFTVLQDGYAGLFDIFTNPDFRRQGFATSAISYLMGRAKENGAHSAYLQVVRDNTNAIRLYSKLGFTELYGEWYRVKSFQG